ncbi:hypothetical protein OAT67_09465, partial [Bacteriovoracaceae bacterium]|nr:hypothetical protein [Bacteriovoracaceae bacterium]
EPLQNLEYDWANSDVATRLMKKIDETTKNISLNHIPFENIFIDRKIVGVFYMLKKIGVPLNLHKLFYKFSADLA